MPEQDLNPALCDASAVLHQLKFKGNWELVIMWVYDKPVDSGICFLINVIYYTDT